MISLTHVFAVWRRGCVIVRCWQSVCFCKDYANNSMLLQTEWTARAGGEGEGKTKHLLDVEFFNVIFKLIFPWFSVFLEEIKDWVEKSMKSLNLIELKGTHQDMLEHIRILRCLTRSDVQGKSVPAAGKTILVNIRIMDCQSYIQAWDVFRILEIIKFYLPGRC